MDERKKKQIGLKELWKINYGKKLWKINVD